MNAQRGIDEWLTTAQDVVLDVHARIRLDARVPARGGGGIVPAALRIEPLDELLHLDATVAVLVKQVEDVVEDKAVHLHPDERDYKGLHAFSF